MSVFSKVYENIWNDFREKNDIEGLKSNAFLTTVFYSTVISSFSWGGDIPDFIYDLPSYIEECLFISSKIAYFEDDGKPYITPCYACGTLLENGMYSHYTCIFRNGRQVIKPIEEVVICDNNSLGVPSRVIVDEILSKCVHSLGAIEMTLQRASTPSINFCNDDKVADLVKVTMNECIYSNNPMALIKSSTFKGDTLHKYDLFDNRAQDVLALWDIFVRFKNLFFSTFGVNNVEISKTERLTRAEGESNTEIIRYALFFDMYEHRVDWARRIKERKGKTLVCSINRNYETVSSMTMSNEEKKEFMKTVITPYMNQNNEEDNNDGQMDSKISD